MASRSRVHEPLTLDQFLTRPDIDEFPSLEFVDGRVERKAVAQKKHSLIQMRLCERLNRHAAPARLGLALPELRCTFAGRSIVPDVVFLLRDHIDLDEAGEPVDETLRAPDIHVEILSPDQAVAKAHRKLLHTTSHGCALGILIQPERRSVDVYRPGSAPLPLGAAGVVEGDPVLPGLRLPVAEVFGWLKLDLGAGPT